MTHNFIKDWRRYRGLTQADLAEQMGMTKVSISRMETGTTRYDGRHLERAAAVLKCTPADLISRRPDNQALVIEGLTPDQQAQILALARAMKGE